MWRSWAHKARILLIQRCYLCIDTLLKSDAKKRILYQSSQNIVIFDFCIYTLYCDVFSSCVVLLARYKTQKL